MNGRYDLKGSFAVHIMIVVGIGNDILFWETLILWQKKVWI